MTREMKIRYYRRAFWVIAIAGFLPTLAVALIVTISAARPAGLRDASGALPGSWYYRPASDSDMARPDRGRALVQNLWRRGAGG